MKQVAIASAILALVAGAAYAEHPFPRVPGPGYGKAVQVTAGQLYSSRDLHRMDLNANTPVTVAEFPGSDAGYIPHRDGR